MSSVVISGDTSGAITLAAPAVAGTNTLTLPATTGTLLSNKTTGVILQVVQSGYNSQVNTSSSTFSSTGFSVSITPQASTNKVLVSFTAPVLQTSSGEMWLALYRGTTQITGEVKVNSQSWTCATIEFLDSPSTTSATTYSLYFKMNSGTGPVYVGTNTTPTGGINNIFVTAKEISA